jgi:TPR repeat protein
MAAFRFINFLLILAALASSAGAAYIFFGRTELDQAEVRLQAYQSRIDEQIPSAKAGDVHSQFRLGRLYRYGIEGTKDLGQAYKWFKTAAAMGHSGAQYELGKMFARGTGVGQSYHRAVEWYGLAARAGRHRSAEFALGELYFFGRGVERDLVDAHRWLLKAADRNHPLAQFYLGEIYEKGWGVQADLIEAYKWYSLANKKAGEIKKLGNRRDPESVLSVIKSRMNSSQLTAAERALKRWKPAQ